ncbi:benzoyl-CoA reductase/2-hydroxyglutaryl-CoA dehydratase subunit BcrC/BadD/HgdB [Paenibacillus forsythiae]|uniref:Benzoyl-CoA reductase/2-hydroxyglutaryl-CoA dehydratase subunit BcrC/BadD/HgdB n=1 Tax=Paenibacillus forsythiae TaxID=365616 RepID=A0ABU3H3P0_9BACL|nr:2-hydroxyacyl-CoA dehydratase family protein [Paenibacillus forsythiae]MDT3425360.1 benzoyl-CoA reductase/2-hydroxyglutaryl-CoA dehydratase subunit BcrC/BadD/HgdB [Paenibacillus forsythiae]
MAINQDLFHYPEAAKELFIRTEDITFRDGTRVSAEEIWEFLTKEAPVRFPHAFDNGRYNRNRISGDIALPYSLKDEYLSLTFNDRMLKAKQKGIPVAFVQGGQCVDPYYAAGAIALRPASVNQWAACQREGVTFTQAQVLREDDKERASQSISFEVCNTAGYEYIQEGSLPVDMIAPYSCLRCSDVSYSLEAHRHGKRQDVKLFLGDFPMADQKNKEWAVEYFAENIKRLIRSIDELTGRETTEEDLRKEIILHNEGRRLSREIAELWWAPDTPPTNGKDRRAILQMGGMEVHGDPEASLCVLREGKRFIEERVRKGVKGHGLIDKPARIFLCGSCVFPSDYRIEEGGGVIVGTDNHWSNISTLVEETGDPYYNLAKATLSYPYEQNVYERAKWTAEQIRKSRADGVLFMYNWGCNTQSAMARMLCDEIKKLVNVPTLIIEHEFQASQSEQLLNRVSAFVEML